MEGFKSNPKMKSDLPCFKEGGSVSKAPKMKAQAATEEKMAKKKAKTPSAAVVKEKETPVEFTAKKGGRAKKETGTVKKYKAGGKIDKKVPGYFLGGLIPNVVNQVGNAVRSATPQQQAPTPSGFGGLFSQIGNAVRSSMPQQQTPSAPAPNPSPLGGGSGMVYAGGNPFFDERTGTYTRPFGSIQQILQKFRGRNRGGPRKTPLTPNILPDRMPDDQMRPPLNTSGVLTGFGPTDAPVYSNDPNAVGYTGMGRGGATYVDGVLQNQTTSMPPR